MSYFKVLQDIKTYGNRTITLNLKNGIPLKGIIHKLDEQLVVLAEGDFKHYVQLNEITAVTMHP